MKSYLLFFLLLSHVSIGQTATQTPLKKLEQASEASSGLIVEHVKNLNTLALSFVDISQPLYDIKLQILKEFLINAEAPKLLLLVSDDRDIKNTNDSIKKLSPKFNLQNIKYVKAESTFLSSSWIRDFSPVMIQKKDGSFGLVIFKYINESDYAVDQSSISKSLNLPIKKINLRLEGGNILSDESGRLYVSTAVIENNLETDYNAAAFEAKKSEIAKTLMANLMVREVVWIPRVKQKFEATGHVDMYIRFLKNRQAIVASSNNSEVNNTLNETAQILLSKGFKVTRLKANGKITNKFRAQKIFPSYTNSILVGNSIFIPKYGVSDDNTAVSTYQKLGYKVIQIDGESIHFGGSVHCLTYLYP